MKYQILIVDDEPKVIEGIKGVLAQSDLDIEFHHAGDGLEGLEKAQALGSVSMFIVDYNMPKLNGLELVERLLQDERFRAVPIMLYTTETNPVLASKAKALSKTIKWVIKPLSPAPFVQAVKGCLGLSVRHIY